MTAAARKQAEIPGTERDRIPDIEEAALALDDVRYRRMQLQIDEARLELQLRERMQAHDDELEHDDKGRPTYVVLDGEYKKTFKLKATLKVACKREKVGDDGGDE